MPQLVVNMKVNTINKIYSSLKNNRFKMRHAPYLNRCKPAPANRGFSKKQLEVRSVSF